MVDNAVVLFLIFWGTSIVLSIIAVLISVQFSSVQFSRSVVSDSLQPNGLQHARPPCHHQLPEFTQTPGISSCRPLLLLLPIPPSIRIFSNDQLFAWGGQSTAVSALASVLPKESQGWSPSEWTGWISLQSKGLSRVFSNTKVQKHQFFGAQPSSQSNSHIHTWPLEKP